MAKPLHPPLPHVRVTAPARLHLGFLDLDGMAIAVQGAVDFGDVVQRGTRHLVGGQAALLDQRRGVAGRRGGWRGRSFLVLG